MDEAECERARGRDGCGRGLGRSRCRRDMASSEKIDTLAGDGGKQHGSISMQVGLHVGRRWVGHGECEAAALAGLSSRRRQRSTERRGHGAVSAAGRPVPVMSEASTVGVLWARWRAEQRGEACRRPS